MKNILIVLFLLMPFFVLGQLITYEVQPDGGLFDITEFDDSENRNPIRATIWNDLDTTQAESVLFNNLRRSYNLAASGIASYVFRQKQSVDLESVISSSGFGSYSDYINGLLIGLLDGDWVYRNLPGGNPIPVTITGDEIRLQSNNNLVGTITIYSDRYVNVTGTGINVDLGTLDHKIWIGLGENGSYYILSK